MADIFLAYARVDSTPASALADRLRREGWTVFMDVQTQVGERWDQALLRELDAARVVVVLWSRASVESRYVLEEADFGSRKGCLLPAFIEHVTIPYGFARIQTADLVDWASAPSGEGICSLIDSILSRLGGKGPEKATSEDQAASSPAAVIERYIARARQSGVDTGIILVGFDGIYGPEWVVLSLVVDGVETSRLDLYKGGAFSLQAGRRSVELRVVAQENGPYPPAGASWVFGLTHSEPHSIHLEPGQIKLYGIVFKSTWLHLRLALEPVE